MAKAKSVTPIIGIGRSLETRLTVQKSNPLFGLWRSELTLAEFKIIDTYLSRIDIESSCSDSPSQTLKQITM